MVALLLRRLHRCGHSSSALDVKPCKTLNHSSKLAVEDHA